jgi:hypothetical protein
MSQRVERGHAEGGESGDRVSEAADSRTDGGALTREAVHGILGNRRRRYTLEFLRGTDGPVGMRELCVAVAARENDIAREEVRPKQRKRVYTALRQTHLPRLAAAGLVEYDRDRSVVTPTDRLTVLDPYFGEADPASRQWADYYLGLGVVGLLFAAGAALDLPVVGLVPDAVCAALIAGAVVVVAAAHRYSDVDGDGSSPPEMSVGHPGQRPGD